MEIMRKINKRLRDLGREDLIIELWKKESGNLEKYENKLKRVIKKRGKKKMRGIDRVVRKWSIRIR